MKKAFLRSALVLAVVCTGVVASDDARAEIRTKVVAYKDGDVTLKGMLAWDTAKVGKRPGVLFVDEWWGLTENARGAARRLAAAGYVAFAADMYGDGRATKERDQARKWMKQVIGDSELWNRRAQLGLNVLKADPNVDGTRLAAIGSSFGGATAIQMAYAGHEIRAAVSIASSLAPAPTTVKAIKPRRLMLIGGADKYVKADKVAAFRSGLDRVKANWEIVTYSGARHSFASPGADAHGIENMAYNKIAAERASAATLTLFDEVFK